MLTINEFVEGYGIGRTKTYEEINSGRLKAVKCGRRTLIPIESAEKWWSLVTADIANSYHRDVFALPGRANDAQSKGCNNLIKSQQAHLITSAADLIYMLGWEVENKIKKQSQTLLFEKLSKDENVVFNYLKEKEKALLDVISIECDIPTFKLAAILLSLELKEIIRPLPGKLFEII